MDALLEYAKGKGVDRASLDARFGGGESLRETLNALDQLSLIERDDAGGVRLNQLGNQVAYATGGENKTDILLDVILGYLPYRTPLERAVFEERDVLEGPWLENIWQVDMNLNQPRNRVEEARTFFFRFLDDATGLGTYRRGVRGQVTRCELSDEALRRFSDKLEVDAKRSASQFEPESMPASIATSEQPAPEDSAKLVPVSGLSVEQPSGMQLRASVDMTNWDLEKIEAFLRLVGYPIVQTTG